MEINSLTEIIIGSAIEVHRALGPGLLESAYEQCLCHELSLRKIPFERQLQLPVKYKGILLILVDKLVVVELKAIDRPASVHDAQLLTHLRLGGRQVGLLINFNFELLVDGIRRKVMGLKET